VGNLIYEMFSKKHALLSEKYRCFPNRAVQPCTLPFTTINTPIHCICCQILLDMFSDSA
jgi:hypothetical protein